jgi:hypothetical protein
LDGLARVFAESPVSPSSVYDNPNLISYTRSRAFAEDTIRLGSLRPLAMLTTSLSHFFFDTLVSGWRDPHFSSLYAQTESSAYKDTINDMILWKPHATSRSNWVSKTGLPFDPFESAADLQHQELLCPKCKADIRVRECTRAPRNRRVLRVPSIYYGFRDGICSTKLLPCLFILLIRNYQGETCRSKANYRSNGTSAA